MDENTVWLAGVFSDGVWAGTEGADVWQAIGTFDPGPEGGDDRPALSLHLGLGL